MWTLCGNKDGNFSSTFTTSPTNDGNRVELISQGLSPEMPEEVRNLVTFKDLGGDKTEVSVTEYYWPVWVT
jgi:hypothetical protein